MNLKLIVPILFGSLFVLASNGEHGSGQEGGIPNIVFYQAVNVSIIFLAGYWFSRHKISAFFHEKRNKFLKDQESAKQALVNAEQEHHEVKTRLDKLKNNKLNTISKAKADANDLQKQILSDAEIMVKRLQREAELASKIELQRAKNELRELLLREAFNLSKKDISSKATAEDQKRLQNEFISKVEVAQ
jgi:F-type H+-transporting ATPase subunit b